jgi:hypothetical protein
VKAQARDGVPRGTGDHCEAVVDLPCH